MKIGLQCGDCCTREATINVGGEFGYNAGELKAAAKAIGWRWDIRWGWQCPDCIARSATTASSLDSLVRPKLSSHSMKQTIEVEFTPTLETIPDLLVDIASLLQALPIAAPTLDVSLEQLRTEFAQALEEANARVAEANARVAEANARITILNRQLDVAQAEEDSDQVQLFATTSAMHRTVGCSQIKRAANPPVAIWIDRDEYEKHKSLRRGDPYLCSFCHGWAREKPSEPVALRVGMGVTIKPHDTYKSYTRGIVKATAEGRAFVLPKGHAHPIWLESSLLRPLVGVDRQVSETVTPPSQAASGITTSASV